MMVAAERRLQVSLAIRCATELATLDDERVLKHAATFQICDECGDRLIDQSTHFRHPRDNLTVHVPAALEQLHEPDTPFEQPTGQQAVVRK